MRSGLHAPQLSRMINRPLWGEDADTSSRPPPPAPSGGGGGGRPPPPAPVTNEEEFFEEDIGKCVVFSKCSCIFAQIRSNKYERQWIKKFGADLLPPMVGAECRVTN